MEAKNKSPEQSAPEYLKAYARLYGDERSSNTRGRKEHFDRSRLPDPLEYYRQHLHALHIRGEWADTKCPFHDDKDPSFSVSLTHGGFLCHGCGASGKDVVDFHQRLFELSFVEAAKQLGAWA